MISSKLKITLLLITAAVATAGIFSFVPRVTHAAVYSVSPYGNRTGLIGAWTFDGKDIINGAARDVTGRGLTGNFFNISTSTFYSLGMIGQGLNFDGVDDYVSISDATFPAGNTSRSISFWAKSTRTSGSSSIMQYGTYASAQVFEIALYDNASSVIIHVHGQSTPNGVNNFPVNKWNHVVATYDGVTAKVYVNGVFSQQQAFSALNTTASAFFIGKGGLSNNFKGSIDDVRVYNRAVSAKEVSQLYNEGNIRAAVSSQVASASQGLSRGLVGYWTFDGKDMLDGVVRDLSNNGNTGYPSGIATSTFYSSGKIGQGVRFDGLDDYVVLPLTSSVKGANSASISAWIKPSSFSASENYVYSEFTSLSNTRISMAAVGGTNGKVDCRARAPDSDSAIVKITSNIVLSKNIWVYMTCVFDIANDSIVIYVNGVLVSSTGTTNFTNSSFDATDSAGIAIGSAGTGGNNFVGSIDNVRIHNRALSASEVLQLYKQGETKFASSPLPKPASGLGSGLVGYWTFDGKDTPWTSATAATTRDVSGGGNNGTLTSMNVATAPVMGKIGQAVNFDGTDDYVDAGTNSFTTATTTVSLWIKPADTAFRSAFELKLAGIGMIVSTSVVTVNDVLLTPRGYLQPITGANAVTPKKWNHVVIQYLGSGLNTLASYRIYVNGVSLTLTNAGGGGGSYNRNYIGRQNHTSFFYKGGIDDLRVYNRTLSDGEILQLYKQGR